MLRNAFLMVSLLLICPIFGLGQNVDKWKRLEGEKKHVSVAFPSDVLIDTHHQDNGQVLHAIAFQNGVLLDLKVTEAPGAEERIDRIAPQQGEQGSAFTLGGMKGRQMISEDKGRFTERIYLAKGDKLYSIRAQAPSKDRPELMRFNYSIMVEGEPIYQRKVTVDFPEETVSMSSVKSSAPVEQAYSRKSDDKSVNIEFHAAAEYAGISEPTSDVRPPVVLERPNPDMRQFMQPGVRPPARLGAKVVIHLLANGQIADIKVYSDSDKSFAKACAQAAKKLKVIPAVRGKDGIDSDVVEDYGIMTAAGYPGMITTRRQ